MTSGDNRTQSPKRPLSQLDEISAAKRLRRSYHRSHVQKHKASFIPSKEPAFVQPESVDKLMIEAIKDILEEEGLKNGIYDPQIESLALEALRNMVDECMRISLGS
jgi:hypothetical protein